MINELGITITNQQAIDLFRGKSFKDIINFIESKKGSVLEFDFEARFRKRTEIVFEKELQTFPGVIDLIESLKVPICIASNGPQIKMETTLKVTGLTKYFDNKNTFSAYDVNAWKPDPKLFLYAAAAMGVDTSKCLVVEDTISGAMGAVHAHMDLQVYDPENQNIFKEKGMETFTEFKDLKRILISD